MKQTRYKAKVTNNICQVSYESVSECAAAISQLPELIEELRQRDDLEIFSHISIYHGANLYSPAFSIKNRDNWRRQMKIRDYQEILPPFVTCIYLHDAKPPYTHLDVEAAIPARLNRPPEELIGKPLSAQSFTGDSVIIAQRQKCIEDALQHGKISKIFYTFDDPENLLHWEFWYVCQPTLDGKGVLAIVEDVHDWQLQYWLNRTDLNQHRT